MKPDIIFGCETKISSSVTTSELLPPNFVTNSYRKDRTSRGGGVIIAIRDGLITNNVEVDVNSEQVWAKIELPGGKGVHIFSFYSPPDSSIAPLEDLERVVKTINPSSDQHVIVAGDLNCGYNCIVRPGAYDPQPNDKSYNLSLTNVQTNPTRKGRNLDIYLTSNPSLIKKVTLVPGMSDHEGMAIIDSDIKPKLNKANPEK